MSYVSLTYHIIVSKKGRRHLITDDIREELYAYIGGILRNKDGVLMEIGGMSDHVHLLVGLHQTDDVASVVRDVKSNSSSWLNDRDDYGLAFGWQDEYGAFTVSQSRIPDLREYIRNQDVHHRKRGFEEEFDRFLVKHGLVEDEEEE